MTNIFSAKQEALLLLKDFDSRHIDCDVLLSFALKKSKTFSHTHPEYELSTQELTLFRELVSRRQQHMPIAYLIGTRSFWDFEFEVTKDTLIPRPETELFIEICESLNAKTKSLSVLDLGTGSGVIAITLAKLNSKWNITATDIQPATLAIAKKNAKRHHCSIEWILSDWFTDIPEKLFDIIISNPPYIEENDHHLLEGDVAFEPRLALTSGTDGLNDIRVIIEQSVSYLKPKGLLLLEHGYDQFAAVSKLLQINGFNDIKSWYDLQGHPRITGGHFARDLST